MNVLVVDDHALIREALRNVVAELDPGTAILEAASCSDAESLINRNPNIDLVLLDLGLPDGEGFVLLKALRNRFPTVAVVVLSGIKDRATVNKALQLGAQGFIPKSATRPVMVNALRLILEGGVYIPPEALASSATGENTCVELSDGASPESLGLTERQLDVLALMMLGKSNKAICRELDLAEATVKNHVTAVLKALGVTNRTEAVITVGTLGWKLPAPKGRGR